MQKQKMEVCLIGHSFPEHSLDACAVARVGPNKALRIAPYWTYIVLLMSY